MLNLPLILHNKIITNCTPSFITDKKPPMISYIYTKNISNRILNRKRTVNKLDLEIGVNSMECQCRESPFTDNVLEHVLTGNLRIVKNRKLRKLLEKGPSYREQITINWKKNLETCLNAIKAYKAKWIKREKVDIRVFNEWECMLIELVKKRINKIKRKHKHTLQKLKCGQHTICGVLNLSLYAHLL